MSKIPNEVNRYLKKLAGILDKLEEQYETFQTQPISGEDILLGGYEQAQKDLGGDIIPDKMYDIKVSVMHDVPQLKRLRNAYKKDGMAGVNAIEETYKEVIKTLNSMIDPLPNISKKVVNFDNKKIEVYTNAPEWVIQECFKMLYMKEGTINKAQLIKIINLHGHGFVAYKSMKSAEKELKG